MANVLSVPLSGNIYFHCGSQSSVVPDLTGSAVSLGYDGSSGIKVTSFNTAASATDRFTVAGTGGSLFSVNDALTGTIFSVNDASGLPIIEVNSGAVTDTISIGEYGTNALFISAGSVGIGTTTPGQKLDVAGNIAVSGTVDGIDIAGRDACLTATINTANAALPKAGGAMTGAITTNSTFDGRNVSVDGTKLDGICSGATANIGTITSVIAGTGLTGGGSTGSVTLNVSGGSGITANANDIAVDATVVRTTGTQSISGNKTFTGDTTIQGNLSVTGDFTYIDTIVAVTSAMSIVNHGTGPALEVCQAGANTIAHFCDSESGTALFIKDGGNVGIGTAAPNGKLDIRQTANSGRTLVLGNAAPSVVGDIDGQIVFTKHPSFYDSWKLYSKNTNAGNGEANLYLDSYNTASTFKNNVTFLNNGNVGIGTTSPNGKLAIESKANGSGYGFYLDTLTRTVNDTVFYMTGNSSGNEFVIKAGGNVGIGTTSPGQKLDVVGNIKASGTVGIGTSPDATNPLKLLSVTQGRGLIIRETDDGNDAVSVLGYNGGGTLAVKTAGANTFYVDATSSVGNAYFNNSGKFGIGTATPNEKLDVVGNIKASGTVTASGSGSSSFVGNVGIGTTTPGQKLDVVGNIAVSGTVDGIDIAGRDACLTATINTANAALPKAGGTMTGAITMNGNNITQTTGLLDTNKICMGNSAIYTSGDDNSIHVNAPTALIPNSTTTSNNACLGISAYRWKGLYAGVGDFAGNITVGGTVDGRDVAVDGAKLDGVATGANNYSLPSGTSSVRGGFKIGYTENGKNYPVEVLSEQMFVNVPWTDANTTYTLSSFGVTATSGELNYTTGVTSAIQTQLNAKTTCTGTITCVAAGNGLTGGGSSGCATLTVGAGTAITVAAGTVGVTATCNTAWNAKTTCTGTVCTLGNLGVTASAAELNYTTGVTSAIQTQLNDKLSLSGCAANTALFDGLDSAIFLYKKADIGASANLNCYTTIGLYHQNSNANTTSGSNYPTQQAGMLTVIDNGAMIYQTYQGYGGNATYERKYYNGAWCGWRTNYDSCNVTATTTELNYTTGVTSAIQTQLNAKTTCTGTITCVAAGNGLTGGGSSGSATLTVGAGTAITVAAGTVGVTTACNTAWNAKTTCTGTVCTLGNLGVTATAAQLNYTTGVTSAIQTQLNTKTTCTGTITCVAAGNGLTGGGSSGSATLTVGAGTAITVAAGTVGVTTACDTAWNAKTTCTGTVCTLGNLGVTATAAQLNYTTGVTSAIQTQLNAKTTCTGTITSVVAGNGLTGGATSGAATLTVGAGTAITVAAGTVGVTTACDTAWNAKTTCTGTVCTLSNLGVTASAAELNYTTGVTSAIQTQLNDKLSTADSVVIAQSLRAGLNISGGGTISVTNFSVKNSTRFIVISNGRGSNFSTSGFYDINIPTSGTVTGAGGSSNVTANSDGVPLAAWHALYYILPIGSNSNSNAANFRVVSYTADGNIPYNWVLLAIRNGDSSQFTWLGGRYILKNGESINTLTYNSLRVNKADCLTTARTIAGVSFNGSANISLNNNAITNGAGYTTCTGDITSVVAGNGLTGGATSGAATLTVGAGTAITVAAGTVGVTTACDTAWNAKTTCTGTVCTLGNLGVTATAAQLNYTTGVTSAIQTQLNGKLPKYSGSVSNVSNSGYTTAFTVVGNSLGSHIRLSVTGTASGIVVSNLIDLVVNHSLDIMVEAFSGIYTRLYIKIISNSDADFAVQFKTNNSNAVTLGLDIVAYSGESVTFTSSHSYTGSTLEVDLEPGKVIKGTGGDDGDFRAYGTVTGANINATGSYQLNAVDVINAGKCFIGDQVRPTTTIADAYIASASAWNAKTTCTGTITCVAAGNGLTGGGSSGCATLTVGAGTAITVAAGTVGVTTACNTAWNAKTTCTGTISSVVAGTGLTGGGSTGSVTLSVGGGSGITAFEDYIDVNSTVVRTTGTQTISGSKTFTDSVTIPNMTSPNAPASVTTSIVGNTIDVTFAESTTLNIDAYLVYSSIAGSDYGLISVITPEDFSASMSVIDNAFTETGTQAYRVYAMKNGVFSSAAASNVSYTVSSAEPSNVEVINMNNAYYVQWNPPSTNARFVTAYNVFKHEAATAGALLRASASQVYSGLNTNYMYQINGTNNNNYHQFWVETTIA